MTNPPADLISFRGQVMTLTGLVSPADVGIVGDGAHARSGGYHEGVDVLTSIGRYHGPANANVGSSTEDYSCRIGRDRSGLTMSASALDIGAEWPHGGRAAWLRWNNSLANALRAGDPELSAIRAINYSPDGSTQWRIDREYGWRTESTTDSVTIHTHIEMYRDTEGRRAASLNRLATLIGQASGVLADNPEDDMDTNQAAKLNAIFNAQDSVSLDTGGGAMKPFPVPLTALIKSLKATGAPVDPAQVATQLAGNNAFVTALAGAVVEQMRSTIDEVVEARLNGATATLSTAGQH